MTVDCTRSAVEETLTWKDFLEGHLGSFSAYKISLAIVPWSLMNPSLSSCFKVKVKTQEGYCARYIFPGGEARAIVCMIIGQIKFICFFGK